MSEYEPSEPLSESGLNELGTDIDVWDVLHSAAKTTKRMCGAVALFSAALYPSNTDSPMLLVSSVSLAAGTGIIHHSIQPWLVNRRLSAELEYYKYENRLDQQNGFTDIDDEPN